jgi:plastocyanin
MVRRLATRAAAAFSALSLSIVIATSTSAAAATSNVTISSAQCAGGAIFCYKPSTLTVTNGSGVKWTDATSVQHTVTRCTAAACNGTGPGSGTDSTFTTATLAPNGTFTHTFHGTGTYNYYCSIHGFAAMHGSVTVQAPK